MLQPWPRLREQRADVALRRDRVWQQRKRDDGRQDIAYDGRRDAPRSEPRELDRPIQRARSAQSVELAWSERAWAEDSAGRRPEPAERSALHRGSSPTHRSTQRSAPQPVLPSQVLEHTEPQVRRELSGPRERQIAERGLVVVSARAQGGLGRAAHAAAADPSGRIDNQQRLESHCAQGNDSEMRSSTRLHSATTLHERTGFRDATKRWPCAGGTSWPPDRPCGRPYRTVAPRRARVALGGAATR